MLLYLSLKVYTDKVYTPIFFQQEMKEQADLLINKVFPFDIWCVSSLSYEEHLHEFWVWPLESIHMKTPTWIYYW